MRRTVLTPLVFFVLLSVGCAARVSYRSYDPYYHDYHTWNDAEAPHYNAWVAETHRSNVDYLHLKHKDQQQYWRWRHDHP